MRRYIRTALISMMAFMPALNGFASGLVPHICTIGDRPVHYPIFDIGFLFDVTIDVVENSIATVYSDGKPVETGVLTCSNFVWEKGTQGTAAITFDPPLSLPKGKTYKLVVPEGVIFREGNPDVSNDELSAEFTVPASLGPATPSFPNGITVKDANRIGFYFRFETAPVEGKKAILIREGIPVKEYPCNVSWDWDLGYAGIDFGDVVKFENGVRYSIVLPEGSVSALYRPDIVNEEAELHFTGGYTGTVTPIQYVGCSLLEDHPSDAIGEVRFIYDRPVALSLNPVVRLCTENDDLIVKEARPSISEENGLYVMTVDFENTPLLPEKRYSVIIPEATLVTKEGDVIVNHRNVVPVENSSGISNIEIIDFDVNAGNGAIHIGKTSKGTEIRLSSLDGRIIYGSISDGGAVSIPVGNTGIYLLTINGKTYKIAV